MIVFPIRDKLSGKEEIDEAFAGGVAECKRGRGIENKPVIVISLTLYPAGMLKTIFWYSESEYPVSRYEEFRSVINAAADYNKKTLLLKKNN